MASRGIALPAPYPVNDCENRRSRRLAGTSRAVAPVREPCFFVMPVQARSVQKPGMEVASDCFLEFLRSAECNLFASCDLHHLARGWIAARACFTLAHLQRAQSTNPDAVTLLQVACDTIDQPTQQILSQL